MPTTYEPIATQTLGSVTSFINFSSIPSTYTDLVVVMTGMITTNGNSIVFQFNGDTGTNYSTTQLTGNGSSISSTRTTNRSFVAIGWNVGFSDTTESNAIANVMNYANTTTNKTVLSRANNSNGTSLPGTEVVAGLWRNTAAINSIKIWDTVSTLKAGFTATIYGIKAA